MEDSLLLDESPGLASVGAWPSLSQAYEYALVVLAMNRECWILPEAGEYSLQAVPHEVPAIRREIALYDAEESEREEKVEPPVFPVGFELAALWIALLVGVFVWQGRDFDLTRRFSNSSLAVIENGEWWRPFTALFLHADAGHLLGNVAIGGIFCVMVAQSLGALRGWALILAAGTIGNAINAMLHFPDRFESIGASTATFGAVGILTGVATALAWKTKSARQFRRLLVPFFAGLIVLGWYGTGGENTDVAGHLLGWTSGMILGAVSTQFTQRTS